MILGYEEISAREFHKTDTYLIDRTKLGRIYRDSGGAFRMSYDANSDIPLNQYIYYIYDDLYGKVYKLRFTSSDGWKYRDIKAEICKTLNVIEFDSVETALSTFLL